ncbi:MAG: SurA N-terminal domain-containing protein [Desulfuromusa sp.]|nr:SurA N-terminal domain-containing protein [Desulfuromusa sp.]
MQRPLFLFFFSLLLVATPVTAKTLSKVAAVVNDDIITTYQLDQAVMNDLTSNTNKNQLDITQFGQVKVQILDKLIDEKLMEQQVKKLGLRVSDEELNSAIADVVLKNGLTDETLKQALNSQGVTMPQYREKVKNEILHYKLLNREVNYKVLVTSKEVRDYFDQNITEYAGGAKLHLNQLIYDLPDGDEKKAAKRRKQLEACRQQLISGKDFNEVLADQGDLASGGEMGELVEEDLSQPLQEALVGLKAGDVCEPLELDGKLYMFQVTSRDSDSDALFEQVKDQIRKKLKREKGDLRLKEWKKELHENARIEIRI